MKDHRRLIWDVRLCLILNLWKQKKKIISVSIWSLKIKQHEMNSWQKQQQQYHLVMSRTIENNQLWSNDAWKIWWHFKHFADDFVSHSDPIECRNFVVQIIGCDSRKKNAQPLVRSFYYGTNMIRDGSDLLRRCRSIISTRWRKARTKDGVETITIDFRWTFKFNSKQI